MYRYLSNNVLVLVLVLEPRVLVLVLEDIVLATNVMCSTVSSSDLIFEIDLKIVS